MAGKAPENWLHTQVTMASVTVVKEVKYAVHDPGGDGPLHRVAYLLAIRWSPPAVEAQTRPDAGTDSAHHLHLGASLQCNTTHPHPMTHHDVIPICEMVQVQRGFNAVEWFRNTSSHSYPNKSLSSIPDHNLVTINMDRVSAI